MRVSCLKSKIFTYKSLFTVAIIIVVLIGFSFIANATIVVPRVQEQEYKTSFSAKLSDDGLFLIELKPNDNDEKYGVVVAFQGADYYLKSATIPQKYDSIEITEIGENAFAGCNTVQKITIPQTIQYIEENAFSGLNDFILYVESESYAEKYALKHQLQYEIVELEVNNEIDYPKTATDLIEGNYCYNIFYVNNEACCALTNYNFMVEDTKLTIPDKIDNVKVTTLAEHSIYNGSVEEIFLPESVTTVGDSAFAKCGSLKKVHFTEKVSYIGESVFEDSPTAVICATPNSYAHQYAEENHIPFEAENS